jgi:hypothetical protein
MEFYPIYLGSYINTIKRSLIKHKIDHFFHENVSTKWSILREKKCVDNSINWTLCFTVFEVMN